METGELMHKYLSDTISFLNTSKGTAFALIFLAVLFSAVFLLPEATVSTFELNDEAMHITATTGASVALAHNLDPTDFWLSNIDIGFPIFHYYQHLPHVIPALIDRITAPILPLTHLFDILRYLLLVLFPVSIYWAMRRFGFDYLPAGIAGFVAPLLSANGLFGIEYGSYLWMGFGIYSQLWAMFFLPPALAEIYCLIKRDNGSWLLSVLLSAVVLLSNLIYGYILIVSVVLFIFLKPDISEIFTRIKRALLFYFVTALVTAYFFIPCFLDFSYYNRSIWFDPLKYNSTGAVDILTKLLTGELFDFGRLSIITALFFIGIVIVITQWRDEKYRVLLALTIFWLLVYFGQPTWGAILNLLPFSQNLHFHRFVGVFQIGAVMVIGAGLALLWERIKLTPFSETSSKLPIVAVVVFMLVMSPVLFERAQTFQNDGMWKTNSQNEFLARSAGITDIKDTFASLPPGRVYVGMPADFGKTPSYVIGYVPMYSVLPQLGLDAFGYAYTAFPLVTDVRLGFDNTKIEQYNLFNIRYVLLAKAWTPAFYYTKLKSFDEFDLYQVPTTGYFDLVDVPAVFYGNTGNFYYPNNKWFVSQLPAQKQHPIVELSTNIPANTHGLPVYSYAEVTDQLVSSLSKVQPSGGTLSNETISPNVYSVQAVVDRDCYLMLKTSYHPGWEVTVDEKKVAPVMLTPGFIGVPVTTGTHQVEFIYKPSSIRYPLFCLGALLLVFIGLFEFRKWRMFRQA